MAGRAALALAMVCSALGAQTSPAPSPSPSPAPVLVPPLTPSAAADTSPVIKVGERVRLWQRVANSLSDPLKGTVTSLVPDSVGVRPDGLPTPVILPRQSITRVDVSGGLNSGSHLTSTLTGMLIGGLSGAVLGVIAGNLSGKNASKGAYYGGAAGLVIGGGIGYLSPGEAWRRAQLPP